jgi:hypothetical protein
VSGDDGAQVFYLHGADGPDATTISGLTITGGISGSGAGISSLDTYLTLTRVAIIDNHATLHGGGVYGSDGGSLTIAESTISGNSASSGGGLYTRYGSGTATMITSSTISGNDATSGSSGQAGGAYFDYASPATVKNSTIYGNHAAGRGGGLYHYGQSGGPGLSITASTISHNTAGVRGGGVVSAGNQAYTQPSFQSTIAAGNIAPIGADVSAQGGSMNAAFSLIQSPDPATTINQTGPDIFGQDPQLGPLADHGGPTHTQLPSATSPVIDKGNAFGLGSDQGGVLRPIDFPAIPNAGDGSDIGAVELQPSNAFKLGKLKRNKKKGTAKQVVILPLPDAGSVTIKGKGLKSKTRQVTGAAKVKLPVIAKGKKRKALNATGKAKIKAKVTYNPTGNVAKTLKRKLKLLKKH